LAVATQDRNAYKLLVYRSNDKLLSQPVWLDRQGKILGREGLKGFWGGLSFSPDGTRAAISWSETKRMVADLPADLWLLDFARGTNSRFTYAGGDWRINPIWSPDGTRIAFSSDPMGGVDDIYIRPASGEMTGICSVIHETNSALSILAWPSNLSLWTSPGWTPILSN
jgi:dipeptidyl aminopeptidase/acylaminoacyl peptidase